MGGRIKGYAQNILAVNPAVFKQFIYIYFKGGNPVIRVLLARAGEWVKGGIFRSAFGGNIPVSQLQEIAEQVQAETMPGRGGLGRYSWGVHIDNGKYSRWTK